MAMLRMHAALCAGTSRTATWLGLGGDGISAGKSWPRVRKATVSTAKTTRAAANSASAALRIEALQEMAEGLQLQAEANGDDHRREQDPGAPGQRGRDEGDGRAE